MYIFTTPEYLLLDEKGCRVIFNRKNGQIQNEKLEIDESELTDCGEVEFFIGLLSIEDNVYLFFVTGSSPVAYYKGTEGNIKHAIKKIDKVVGINVTSDASAIRAQLQPPTNVLKQNTGKLLKFFSDKIKDSKPPALLDDVLRLFNDSKDFFFCRERNVTISAQKFFTKRENTSEESFFWNKYMLENLMLQYPNSYLTWTCPIMQGYVANTQLEICDQINVFLNITIISRRSTHRAGARYLRRGIDEQSNVANFVETELILNIFEHELSFVQIRGSIPVFWSQKGFKYRPPLIINKSVDESHQYFENHINRLKKHYGTPLVAVSLVDQRGRELGLGQRFLEHCIKLNDPDFSFISFDLHQHCRGLNFQKLQTLISSMDETLKKIGFCWVDKTGEVVQRQNGVLRINCIDCLDRTNLVQGQISLQIVLQQAQRLGIFGPLCEPPEALVTTLQTMWADNGDTISTQYAGTAALKGDVTRSGERKLAGIMKDGYNSASRYYLTHTRDAARQKAINLVTKQSLEEEEASRQEEEEDNEKEEDENICRLVTETIQFVVPTQQTVIASWGLINQQGSLDEIDTIVILTREKLYVASYEIDGEKMSDLKIVALEDVRSIEIGMVGTKQCTRIEALEETFIWRPSQVRLFNNAAIRLKTLEEANEYITSVAEQINVGRNMSTKENSIVQFVPKIAIPQTGVHRRSLAAMGSLIGKIKNVKNSKMLTHSESSKSITDGSGGGGFLKNTFKRGADDAQPPQSPFSAFIAQISESKTKISLL